MVSHATRSQPAPPGSTLFLLSDSACEIIEQQGMHDEPERFIRPNNMDAPLIIPQPLHLYNVIREAAGPDGLEDDFSAIVFDL